MRKLISGKSRGWPQHLILSDASAESVAYGQLLFIYFFVVIVFCLFVSFCLGLFPLSLKANLVLKATLFHNKFCFECLFLFVGADVHPSHWKQILFWRHGRFTANLVLKNDRQTDQPTSLGLDASVRSINTILNMICIELGHRISKCPIYSKQVLSLGTYF